VWQWVIFPLGQRCLGIPLARVCDVCAEEKLSRYRADILTDSNYWADEDTGEEENAGDGKATEEWPSEKSRGPSVKMARNVRSQWPTSLKPLANLRKYRLNFTRDLFSRNGTD
jgi:hypothetical protein